MLTCKCLKHPQSRETYAANRSQSQRQKRFWTQKHRMSWPQGRRDVLTPSLGSQSHLKGPWLKLLVCCHIPPQSLCSHILSFERPGFEKNQLLFIFFNTHKGLICEEKREGRREGWKGQGEGGTERGRTDLTVILKSLGNQG